MTSFIPFIVLLLAAYSYSAPIVGELENTTLPIEVELSTGENRVENVTITLKGNPAISKIDGNAYKNSVAKPKKDESSEESKEISKEFGKNSHILHLRRNSYDSKLPTATDKIQTSTVDASLPTEKKSKRGLDIEQFESSTGLNVEQSESSTSNLSERDVTEDTSVPSSSEMNNIKRGMDIEQFESSTGLNVEQSESSTSNLSERDVTEDTSVPSSSEMNITERGMDIEQFESSTGLNVEQSESSTSNLSERDVTEDTSVPSSSEMNNIKRGMDIEQFESSTGLNVEQSESSTSNLSERDVTEDTSVPSSSEMNNIKHDMGEHSLLSDDMKEKFNRRAIGSVHPVETDESSTIVVTESQPELTTSEQVPSSTNVFAKTTGLIQAEQKNVSESETTVAPREDLTTVTSVPTQTTRKILKIIPGQISKTEVIVQPPVQEQLSQGQNQTISA